VAALGDTFLYLAMGGTGDQLQGIKKGILEISDVIAVNKADGEREQEAKSTARELTGALRLVYSGSDSWVPPVLTCSGITGAGIDAVWEQITGHRDHLGPAGLGQKRADQRVDFLWSIVRDKLEQRLTTNAAVDQVQ